MRRPRFCWSCYAFRDAIVCWLCKADLVTSAVRSSSQDCGALARESFRAVSYTGLSDSREAVEQVNPNRT